MSAGFQLIKVEPGEGAGDDEGFPGGVGLHTERAGSVGGNAMLGELLSAGGLPPFEDEVLTIVAPGCGFLAGLVE